MTSLLQAGRSGTATAVVAAEVTAGETATLVAEAAPAERLEIAPGLEMAAGMAAGMAAAARVEMAAVRQRRRREPCLGP